MIEKWVTNMAIEYISVDCISAQINGINLYTFTLPVKVLVMLSYVAVRGRDKEEGAVQRVLNRQRISSIKDYVLGGTMFVNTFVLNWNNDELEPTIQNKKIEIPLIDAAAQLIDGQHRLAGIEEAIKEKPDIGDKSVLVTMAIGLNTKSAATIFLNINTEQRPAPRSLIYDLYGIADDEKNFSITRATDLAHELNDDIDSPFYNLVKFPGMPRGKGRIDLSTIVSTLKEYVDRDGVFARNSIRELDMQKAILINYFNALKYYAERDGVWGDKTQNVLLQAAGFVGSMEFFVENVLSKCVDKRSFKEQYIRSLFDFSRTDFISFIDIKFLDGKTARKTVKERLAKAFIKDVPDENDYEY